MLEVSGCFSKWIRCASVWMMFALLCGCVHPCMALSNPEQTLYQLNSGPDSIVFSDALKIDMKFWRETEAINFGRKTNTGWALLVLKERDPEKRWLEISGHFMDSVEVWIVSRDTVVNFKPLHYRSLVNNSGSPTVYRYFLYEFEAKGTTKIFIRAKTHPGDVLKFGAQVWNRSTFLNYFQRDLWGWALFAGVALVAIGTVLINFIFHRKIIYLCYAGYVFSGACYALLNDGWGIYLPEALSFLDNIIALGHWLNFGVFCFTWFIRKFLVISDRNFKWYPPLVIFLVVELDLFMMHIIHHGNGYSEYIKVGYVVGLMAITASCILCGLYIRDAILRKFESVWLLLLAIISPLCFYFTNILLFNTALLDNPVSDMLAFRVAFVAELAVLTVAWLYRQRGIIQEKIKLENENLKLHLEIINVQNAERERIARDLHDDLGGMIATVNTRLSVLLKGELSNPFHEEIKVLSGIIGQAGDQVRQIAHNLMPPEFEKFGLVESVMERVGSIVSPGYTLSVFGNERRMSAERELNIYRILMEVFNNIQKHAGATAVTVQFLFYHDLLTIVIEDNGRQDALKSKVRIHPGIGLKNINSRLLYLNGRMQADKSNLGTTLIINMPYDTSSSISLQNTYSR